MKRLLSVSQAQDQLLEVALELYRRTQRLHRCREAIAVPCGTALAFCEGEGAGGPPLLELALADDIRAATDEFSVIADGLRQASRLSDASLREEWRAEHRA